MKRFSIIFILICAGINLYPQSDTVIFSATGGFYDDSFNLTLSNNNPENRSNCYHSVKNSKYYIL